jgi:membrane-bound lytic murein transglycosylase D
VIRTKILSGFIGILLFASAYAGKIPGHSFKDLPAISDSTGTEDSTMERELANDPKQQFRDLFQKSQQAVGIVADQLNPQVMAFVEGYIESSGKRMEDLKKWGRPYFDRMDAIFETFDLPRELKYLAVVESNLNSNARSWAGAVGPWQFMPTTARNMGLKIGKKYDERKDLIKSTRAACKYLSSLYALYGDWLLVIAAYNGGPGAVNSAIKRSKSRDFWTLQKFLPAESRNHVKKFIATHYFMEGAGSIATATKEEAKNITASEPSLTAEEKANSTTQSISGRFNSGVIVKYLSIDLPVFNKWNPGFDKAIAMDGSYELRLPAEKMEMFLSKKADILNESMQLLLNPAASSTL